MLRLSPGSASSTTTPTASAPLHPQTNGKDERFHRTRKAEVLALRSFDSAGDCQQAFDRWRQVYNHQRPMRR